MSAEKKSALRAAAYARTSLVLGQDPELQLATIREYASRNGIKLIEEFTDQISGSTSSRPSLDRMVKKVKARAFDVVIVTALDRLGRSSSHMLSLIPVFRDHKCGLISLRESISLDTPAGRAFYSIMSVLAELDREVISERIKTALRAKKIIAEQTGSDWSCGRKKVVTDEIIAEVLKLRSEGVSIRGIEKRMDRRVSRSTVERILKIRGPR